MKCMICHLKKIPKTDIDKIQNRTIDEFNIKLNEFKTSPDSFIERNNYNIDNSRLKSFLANHYGIKEKKNLQKKILSSLLMSKLIEDYIEVIGLFICII